MEYHKPFKPGRNLQSGRGPRDLQRIQNTTHLVAANNIDLVKELKSQIAFLREELNSRPVQKGYSAEEFDAELVKVSEQIMIDIEKKFKSEIEILKTKLEAAEEIIRIKEDTILTLKSAADSVAVVNSVTDSNNRPQMEEAFIDPLAKDAQDGLESHIIVRDDIQEDEQVDYKVDKLKALLGRLPKGE